MAQIEGKTPYKKGITTFIFPHHHLDKCSTFSTITSHQEMFISLPLFNRFEQTGNIFVRLDWRIYPGMAHLTFIDNNFVNKNTEGVFVSAYKEEEKQPST